MTRACSLAVLLCYTVRLRGALFQKISSRFKLPRRSCLHRPLSLFIVFRGRLPSEMYRTLNCWVLHWKQALFG